MHVHVLAVERRLIDLEISRVQHQPARRLDRHRHAVGHAVRHPDELERERPDRDAVVRLHPHEPRGGVQTVLLQLGLDQGQRERRTVDRAADVGQHVRDRRRYGPRGRVSARSPRCRTAAAAASRGSRDPRRAAPAPGTSHPHQSGWPCRRRRRPSCSCRTRQARRAGSPRAAVRRQSGSRHRLDANAERATVQIGVSQKSRFRRRGRDPRGNRPGWAEP